LQIKGIADLTGAMHICPMHPHALERLTSEARISALAHQQPVITKNSGRTLKHRSTK
jgi:hypothetical protein